MHQSAAFEGARRDSLAAPVIPADIAVVFDRLIVSLAAAMPGHHVAVLASGTPALEEVRRFMRVQQQSRGLHHLHDTPQLEIERWLRIAERCTHCCLYFNDEPVALVRLTPAPFECGALHPAFERLTAGLSGHVEFSRLVASRKGHDVRRVPLLLAHASRWARAAGFDGCTAVARAAQSRLYRQFGMQALHPSAVRLQTRGDQGYWLMQADWSQVAASAMALGMQAGLARPMSRVTS
jgi:hypothetical protein